MPRQLRPRRLDLSGPCRPAPRSSHPATPRPSPRHRHSSKRLSHHPALIACISSLTTWLHVISPPSLPHSAQYHRPTLNNGFNRPRSVQRDMNTPPKLSFACPMPWTQMSGTDRQKFCHQCGHHVSNLSLLSATERAALISRSRTERVCGTYYVRLSGEMVTPESPLSPTERRSLRQFGVAALSVAALAVASGCISQPQTKAMPASGTPDSTLTKKDPTASPAGETVPRAENKKAEEEEVILLGGYIVCDPAEPRYKFGHDGKGAKTHQ